MDRRFAVIGAGRQGTAAAFDLARFAEGVEVLLADSQEDLARTAAERVNRLLGRTAARPAVLDAGDPTRVESWLRANDVRAFVSAVPYFFNLGLTRAAIACGCGMTDLGGNSDVVCAQLELSPQAAAAGACIVPDCGQVPGMGTSLIVYAMEQLDEPREVFMWDCGLPADPQPPWNYRLGFSIEGLTNEFYGDCLYIRDGHTVRVPALAELEIVDFPAPIGPLEAFTTAGGLTTAALTFAGRLDVLQNKTLRYPGSFAQLKLIQQLGLLNPKPMDLGGVQLAPRQVLHALWDPQIRAAPGERDLIIIRILARGTRAGRPTDVHVELIHYLDETTGFTAMEQGTGWHAAILTHAIAGGKVPPGVVPVEAAMTGLGFVAEGAKRGFVVRLDVKPA
ncbi:MAG: saccharopine dehydrogenase NADP-binding domain-containing protein [Anaerolineales bacterium]|nr:saccharopine dehydrogenase NADP-binding domain-containing protein [Anaerolineales bacterium]